MTDQKGIIGPGMFGVLLVDTPEMGGRSAMDRIDHLLRSNNLKVELNLRVHDPDGFTPDEDPPTGGSQRRTDRAHPVPPSPEFASAGVIAEHDGNGGNGGQRWNSDREPSVMQHEMFAQPPIGRLFFKRAFDIVASSAGLVVCGPIILAAMAKIRWEDRGTPIFKQTREGRHGKPFTIYKLRTMVVGAEKMQADLRKHSHRDGPAFKIENDPRITRTGRFLRRSCIDELPQLWNVLKGEMSLVGPRPLPWLESRACVPWHRRRLDVRPGLTCYWQIKKGEVKNFDEWMRLDLRYLDEFNLIEDVRLIIQTLKVPILGRGSE
ncbi:sugar transferase [Rubripirellula lacrimiformis]|nr:sugar transferase [Rubripirellula lacrimiformis]